MQKHWREQLKGPFSSQPFAKTASLKKANGHDRIGHMCTRYVSRKARVCRIVDERTSAEAESEMHDWKVGGSGWEREGGGGKGCALAQRAYYYHTCRKTKGPCVMCMYGGIREVAYSQS